MPQVEGPLLLLGCGKMGGALLSRWLDHGLAPDQAAVIEPYAPIFASFAERGVARYGHVTELPADFRPSMVIFAVKPQMMDDAIGDFARFGRAECVFLSIAAGKTLGYFENRLGAAVAIVRSMPNTPALVGRGMSVLVANSYASQAQCASCEALLSSVGDTVWVTEEALLDPVTAVSGGGPAYVFLLIECMAKAGIAAGLPEELARRIARSTVAGAGELVRQSSEPVEQLRQNVTSPGGTTLAALEVLMAEDGLQPLMTQAIAAASRRSRELA